MQNIQKIKETVRRGRPESNDRSKLKTCTMTICITPDLYKKLCKVADKNNQKVASMARILIESAMSIK